MAKKFFYIFAAALLLTVVPAFADTIVQTQPFNGVPNMSGPLTFNQFDDNGGLWVLSSIEIEVNLQANCGQLVLDNDSQDPAAGNFEFGAKGSISSSDVSLTDIAFNPITGQVDAYYSGAFSLDPNDLGDGSGDYDPTPPDGMQYNGTLQTDSSSAFVNVGAWTGYMGSGTYDIDYSVIQWLDYGSISGIEVAFTPVNACGDVTVTYTYEVIPEPTTIALLTISTLGFLKRKKQ
ncbi:MAG: PEP-CTERM sorting domain-containing protein [Sedimentisphaerales bacterium]|nr:PEP-CTERM sorting domain-containing protein [Sedimentisphaerales bacterium]